jgi:hypothetical protein
MCVLCASIPTVLAVGTGIHAQQKRKKGVIEMRGVYQRQKQLPVLGITIGLSAGILICSMIYHAIQ